MQNIFSSCSRAMVIAFVFVLIVLSGAIPLRADQVLRDGDRIVFVGDSITGQGGRMNDGWVHLIRRALDEARPNGQFTITALGGSGQTVGSWQNVEKRSREESKTLDVPNVDVKATLDGGCEVLIIMLGMNDVLSPSLRDEENEIEAWAGRYRELITSLRERAKPRAIALATVPPCTEDARSPKNWVLEKFSVKIREIAKEIGAVVLPVHESEMEVLARGRMLKPDFHVTGDYVHPNAAGHHAIALGMLRGLGEDAAAGAVEAKLIDVAFKPAAKELPALSYTLERKPSELGSAEQSFNIHAFWIGSLPIQTTAAELTLGVPDGWTVSTAASDLAKSSPGLKSFVVTGKPNRLMNTLKLEGKSGDVTRAIDINIPAPWLIGYAAAPAGGTGWDVKASTFDPSKGKLAIDDDLVIRGIGLGKVTEIAPGKPITWHRYIASVDYTGGATSGSVDMAAVAFYSLFDVAYGARWIHCDKEHAVKFQTSARTFAGNNHVTLWVNGQEIYTGQPSRDRDKNFPATLKPGWNAIVFKSNHLAWQWQFALEMLPAEASDDLNADLRVSTVKPVDETK